MSSSLRMLMKGSTKRLVLSQVTSAMLFSNPSTFVSMVGSPGNALRTSRKSSIPSSSRKTLQVLGDSSVRFQRAERVNLRVMSRVFSCMRPLTMDKSFFM